MHMLLTGGEHPLYDPILYNAETYKNKLLEISEFAFPNDLSFLVKNLFHRLTHFNLT